MTQVSRQEILLLIADVLLFLLVAHFYFGWN